MIYRITCLIGSSAGYALAFIYPHYFWWMVFFAFVPIFYTVLANNKISFWDGGQWGIIFFGIHMFAILRLLQFKAEGELRLLGYGILVLYFSLYSGIWFWLMNKIPNKVMGSFVTTFCYFEFLQQGIFWPLSKWFGYPFAYPLLPLVQQVHLLQTLPLVGQSVLFATIVAFQLACAEFLIRGSKKVICFAVATLAPFTLFYSHPLSKESDAPIPVSMMGYVGAPPHADDPWSACQEIIESIRQLRKKYPEVSIIMMPESSLKCALNSYPKIINAISDNALYDGVILCIGSHRTDENQLFNCLYSMQHCLIIHSYDKQNLLPLCEYLPYPWNGSGFIKNLFLNRKKEFRRGCVFSQQFLHFPQFSCRPLICSELYCGPNKLPELIERNCPILCIANDGWFDDSPYFQQLMTMLAHYRSLQWNVPIIYISHSGGWWFNRNQYYELKK